jgi:hypothetical protein
MSSSLQLIVVEGEHIQAGVANGSIVGKPGKASTCKATNLN